jgi:hypothetical protein
VRRHLIGSIAGLAALGAVACQELTPTSIDDEVLPDAPVTLELEFSWDDFASNLEVIGGYGSPKELGTGVLAKNFAGELNSRTLWRYESYPKTTTVRDSLGTTRGDTLLTFVGGRAVIFFDTIASTNEEPVTLSLGATQNEWDANTVTWTTAVDTIHDRREWPEAGAGPVAPLGTLVWDPAEGDSVWFDLDSAQVAAWADTTDATRGARLEVLTEGVRVQVFSTVLRLDTRPSINQDTLVVVSAQRGDITFVYDPFPEPPPDGIRIGGAPAWRTVVDITIPSQLNGPAALCDAVGCPVTLDASQLNYAAIVLRSRETQKAFQPTDSVGLDVRPVLDRSALPKAPLGTSLLGTLGRRVGPALFADEAGAPIEIPITAFAQALLTGEDIAGFPPPKTLALLSIFEPVSIAFASFFGPDGPEAPTLKLIVTVGRPVKLP